MTRLERALAREAIAAFAIGTALYVSLFLVQALLARGEYLSALPVASLVSWLANQVPHYAVQSFPMAVVLTVLLVIGRSARDNELLAAHAGGVSLARLARPLVGMAALLVLAALLLAEFVVPGANRRTTVTWWDSVDGGSMAMARLQGRSLEVGPYQLYFGAYDARSRELRDVRLESWDGERQTLYLAAAATLDRDVLRLRGYRGFTLDLRALPVPDGADAADVLERLVPFTNVGSAKTSSLGIKLPQDRDELVARNAGGGFEDPRPISAWYRDWQASTGPARAANAVEFGFRTAVPFANLAILMLAIPVAARGSRSVGVAFGLSFVITIGYYLTLFVGKTLGQQGALPPALGPWLVNAVFLAAGVWMLRRARFR